MCCTRLRPHSNVLTPPYPPTQPEVMTKTLLESSSVPGSGVRIREAVCVCLFVPPLSLFCEAPSGNNVNCALCNFFVAAPLLAVSAAADGAHILEQHEPPTVAERARCYSNGSSHHRGSFCSTETSQSDIFFFFFASVKCLRSIQIPLSPL